MIKQLLRQIGELLMPFDIRCSLCNSEYGMGSGLGICEECSAGLPALTGVIDVSGMDCLCIFEYDGDVRRMITNLKYHGKSHYARTLGMLAADGINSFNWMADYIVPVPLHPQRRRMRGYNQSELIAKEIFANIGIPVATDLIKRIKKTRPQPGLSHEQRIENLQGAIEASENVYGKSILLIDDVLTTGSTLTECYNALVSNGAKCRAIAISRAIHNDGEPA